MISETYMDSHPNHLQEYFYRMLVKNKYKITFPILYKDGEVQEILVVGYLDFVKKYATKKLKMVVVSEEQ